MRVGLAGGGSDDAASCEEATGVVVSAAVNLLCHASVSFTDGPADLRINDSGAVLDSNGLALRSAAHAHMKEAYGLPSGIYSIETCSDLPPGCGLGSSSSLVVAIVCAYSDAFELDLGREEVAHAAWTVERERLRWPGGRQDQYAAAYGGLHCFRFGPGGRVDAEPMEDPGIIGRLQSSLCLFNANSYKRVPATRSQTSAKIDLAQKQDLRQDAIRMWDEMRGGDLSSLPSLMEKAQAVKGVSTFVAGVLHKFRQLETVEAVKLCGSGPDGIFLLSHSKTFEQVVEQAAEVRLQGSFLRIAVAAPR